MKNKTTAGLLSFFLGGLGVHRFYLGQTGLGILYLVFCWTFIPAIVALVDAIIFFTQSEEAFNLKYNNGLQTVTFSKKSPLSSKSAAPSTVNKTMQWVHERQFERLKPKIEAELPISLDSYEEQNMKPFFETHYPERQIKIVAPLIIKTTVAGIQYHDAKKKAVKDMLKEPWGEILDLEREPNNAYGGTATKILWKQYFLGYVPKELSKEVSEAIDSGKEISASIDNYDHYESPFNRLKIEIRIDLV